MTEGTFHGTYLDFILTEANLKMQVIMILFRAVSLTLQQTISTRYLKFNKLPLLKNGFSAIQPRHGMCECAIASTAAIRI